MKFPTIISAILNCDYATLESGFNYVPKVILLLLVLGFSLPRSVIGEQNWIYSLNQLKAIKNQSCLARPRFPALGAACYMYFLLILIGSLGYLRRW